MAKKDLELLIEKQFFKSDKVLGTRLLNEIIIDSFFKGFQLDERAAKKKEKVAVKKEAGKRTISFSSLPDIAISEIGWSSLETTADGAVISSEQRARLDNYLKNIEGNTFEEKIQSINRFYKFRTIQELESSGVISGDSRSSRIQKVISYLVFLKTLTTIITNFNASAAGFAFESFLSVLLGGKQISATTGEDAGRTIADLKTGDGTYISLKLYAEDGLKVGGSYVDLVNDMINKPFIRYIAAAKSLSGKQLDLQGSIKFYQFDINLDNIMDIIIKSRSSQECIELPIEYIKNKGKTNFADLKRREVPDEEIQKFFNEKINQKFAKNKKFIEEIGIILAGLDTDHSKKYKANLFLSDKIEKLGYSKVSQKFIKSLIKDMVAQKIIPVEQQDIYLKDIISCFEQTRQFKISASSAGELESKLNKIQWAKSDVSLAYYNSLKGADDKANALRNTKGYLYTKQFDISRAQLLAVIGGDNTIGEIVVGRANIETMINQMAGILDETIFEIFDSLSELTTNINTFFATGLQDESAASQAQIAAQNIDKKTEEVKGNAGQ